MLLNLLSEPSHTLLVSLRNSAKRVPVFTTIFFPPQGKTHKKHEEKRFSGVSGLSWNFFMVAWKRQFQEIRAPGKNRRHLRAPGNCFWGLTEWAPPCNLLFNKFYLYNLSPLPFEYHRCKLLFAGNAKGIGFLTSSLPSLDKTFGIYKMTLWSFRRLRS